MAQRDDIPEEHHDEHRQEEQQDEQREDRQEETPVHREGPSMEQMAARMYGAVILSAEQSTQEALELYSRCPICMNPWEDNGAHRLIVLPCGHLYGKSCAEKWIARNPACPECNARVTEGGIRIIVPRLVFAAIHRERPPIDARAQALISAVSDYREAHKAVSATQSALDQAYANHYSAAAEYTRISNKRGIAKLYTAKIEIDAAAPTGPSDDPPNELALARLKEYELGVEYHVAVATLETTKVVVEQRKYELGIRNRTLDITKLLVERARDAIVDPRMK